MKISAAFLAGFLIAVPAYAQEQTPKPPTNKEILMTGLSKVAVCIRSNHFATEKVRAIIKRMQKEGSDKLEDDGTKILNEAADAYNELSMITQIEQIIARSLVDMLVDDYDYKLEDLNKSLTSIVAATDKKLNEIFKDIDEFPEFNKLYKPKLEACSDMIEELGTKVKEMREEPKIPKKST